jgi:hypothetical protein
VLPYPEGPVDHRQRAEFAKLYVNGPQHLRGDWIAVAKFLGFEFPPPLSDPELRKRIEGEGGILPPIPKALPGDSDFETIEHDSPEALIAEAQAIDPEGDPSGWRAMANRLRGTMEEIARSGRTPSGLAATAAQVSAIKTIFDRAEGRVAEKATEKEAPTGIVILPEDNFACPKCGYRG